MNLERGLGSGSMHVCYISIQFGTPIGLSEKGHNISMDWFLEQIALELINPISVDLYFLSGTDLSSQPSL
jgi:hypothetical protein